MPRIVIELTNRCNLQCQHCFSGRHGGSDELALPVLERLLGEARPQGFDEISFTGGDPTLHTRFPEVLRLTGDSGYRFGFVTNGWNFATILPRVERHLKALDVITFSLDGASEETHDRLRGSGSYNRVLQAMSLCVYHHLPFTNNMVVTAHNRHEIAKAAELLEDLGSKGIRFSHLMHSPETTALGWDLSPSERLSVEAEIWELRQRSKIPVGFAPGYHTTSLFPCAPLNLDEVNVDFRGRLTKCCHLSSQGGDAGEGDVVGDLNEMSFGEALEVLKAENAELRSYKKREVAAGGFSNTDFFTCWHCSLYYRKVDWLGRVKENEWGRLVPMAVGSR